MTALDLDAIERAAREAHPQIWNMPDSGQASVSAGGPFTNWDGLVATCDAGDYARSKSEGLANARHIATSCPSTVLAMVVRIREQDATIAKLVEAIEPFMRDTTGFESALSLPGDRYVKLLVAVSTCKALARAVAEVKQGAVIDPADPQEGK